MDKSLIKDRFSKASATYDENAYVQRYVAHRLIEKLSLAGVCSRPSVLEVGCGTGIFTKELLRMFSPFKLWLNDLCEDICVTLPETPETEVLPMSGDAEILPFPDGLDMIVSSSVIQWFADLPGFIEKSAVSLSPGGILAFATYGERNMEEMAAVAGTTLRYHSMKELVPMLSGRFEIMDAEEAVARLHFSSAISLLRHIKGTGVSGVKREFWTKGRLESFGKKYAELFPSEEGLPLTYHPIWIVARKHA